jgi:anaerobic dimethyl sulfoxide reductase subunit B (iron-sulfur subunit)
VYEVSGGSWQHVGDAWVTDVFAYNLTVACNHCVHPKCAGVCPTDAFVTRADGIVYIDEAKCVGCGYCSWACPYSAPQYNPERGLMGKCNFCYDNLDAGLPPACVAACPLRVLDFISVSPLPLGEGQGVRALWQLPASQHPYPLPNFSRTQPHLAIKPHVAMAYALEKTVSNREEVKPKKVKSELPLVAFTLLGQMAAGIALFSFFSGPLSMPILVLLGVLITSAGLGSLLHLGAPRNAWRAAVHLKKSWLSREILMFGLFGISWSIAFILPGMGKLPLAFCGIALVYSMAQVYRLRSIPAWDRGQTVLAFALSAVLLGGFGLKIVALFAKTRTSVPPLDPVVTTGLLIALALSLTEQDQIHRTARKLRLGLIGLGLAGSLVTWIVPVLVGRWLLVPIFMIVLIEEGLGRWLFYEHLHERII